MRLITDAHEGYILAISLYLLAPPFLGDPYHQLLRIGGERKIYLDKIFQSEWELLEMNDSVLETLFREVAEEHPPDEVWSL